MSDVQDLKNRFKSLTEKRDQNKVKQIELETQIRVAKENLEKKVKQLKSDFGLDSVEDAEKEISRLSTEIDSDLTECEEFLAGYEV